ncbi:MAG: RluA family pseudouridine synthase [Lactobacillus sp.]|jgi:23S rRNA pseudouridine1911/1915/1917 synthase|nr:RluA family pseudouridine synthase [Lactobacillus sp.]
MITKTIILPDDYQATGIRQQLKRWFIPKKWQHFLRIDQNILVNNTYRPFNSLLQAGDKVTLRFTELDSPQNYLADDFKTLSIFYEDQDLIVVAKPAHIKTHPNQPGERGTLLNQVAGYLAQSQQKPYILHRLDMATSGLIVFAKNPLVVPILNAKFRDKIIHRYYLALIKRNPHIQATGQITAPIGFDPNDKRKRQVRQDGLPAKTRYDLLAENNHYQLLKLTLETGRTHQIRVHLAHLGVPIIGDPLYETPQSFPRLLLYAYQIDLSLPFSDKQIAIQTPYPAIVNHFLGQK